MNVDIDSTQIISRKHATLLKRNGDVLKDPCLGKYCWQTESWGKKGDILCHEEYNHTTCNHTLSEWLTGCSDWTSRLEIRRTPGMGYGLFSKVAWNNGEIIGPYLGELVPRKPAQTEYAHRIHIGPKFWKKETEALAYVDAEEAGSFVRFANHACEYNALIEEARVGDERVLALRARKDIEVGDQVCVDYGDEYFVGGRYCLCGSGACKYRDGGQGSAKGE
jgi:SET domain-containing protein